MEIADNLTPGKLRAMPSRLVNMVSIAANRLTDRALEGTGSRRYHFALLAALDEFGPSSQAALGRCTAIDRSDVVAAVNAMVERGYVERSPDPSDGRRNIIAITAGGRDHLDTLSTLLANAQDELLRSLSDDERNTLVRLLTRIMNDRSVSSDD